MLELMVVIAGGIILAVIGLWVLWLLLSNWEVLVGLVVVGAWILFEISTPHRVVTPVVAPGPAPSSFDSVLDALDAPFTNLPPRTVAPAGGP